ncbi:hypothetical protein [Sandaracinus amylolyticus]|uniref:hypothetical protein n=1 Tax=Sandaracinus amylolyticus TaxID=927083 RepID=UPI001F29081B|nr:hypothetical protein [Sandaracinus amylolyticus]UJR86206.1 Hypothetical protein I5071_82880 [Sandaracinus amylolyticus]
MRWKDVEGGGLAIEVDAPRVPTLFLESFPGWRIRLMRRGTPVLWARMKGAAEGVWIARAEGAASPGVLPPITAREARATTRIEDWMRFVARGLDESAASPLRVGPWQLTELRSVGRDALEPIDVHRRPSRALDVRAVFDVAPVHYLRWGLNGARTIVPLRTGSAIDASRVKAWRKHVRDGTLPPIVLWWVSMLDAYVLLDGHDRLRAALAEDVLPRAIALWEPRGRARWRMPEEDAVRGYERAFRAEHRLSENSRRTMTAFLLRHFAPDQDVATTARGRPSPEEWSASSPIRSCG